MCGVQQAGLPRCSSLKGITMLKPGSILPTSARGRTTALLRRLATVAGTAVLTAAALLVAPGTAQADGHGIDHYGVWATGVNVRDGGEFCQLYPGPFYCDRIVATVSAPKVVWVYCQQEGGLTVGGNPYWVWVMTENGTRGWMASYYIKNQSNWIDGVPNCRD